MSFLAGGGSVVPSLFSIRGYSGSVCAEVSVFSLGGGTGTATDAVVSDSLFTNKTFIGPDWLFKCI